MKTLIAFGKAAWRLYADGFRQMTWGRTLWVILVVKLVVLFGILRLFFFEPALSGLSPRRNSKRWGATSCASHPASRRPGAIENSWNPPNLTDL